MVPLTDTLIRCRSPDVQRRRRRRRYAERRIKMMLMPSEARYQPPRSPFQLLRTKHAAMSWIKIVDAADASLMMRYAYYRLLPPDAAIARH